MILEISVAVIAFAFLLLVIFVIFSLRDARRIGKKVERLLLDAHKTLEKSEHLIHNTDELVVDMKKKAKGLDVLFTPLYALHNLHNEKKEPSKLTAIFECAAEVVQLIKKIKNDIIS